jgi:hypothetical protein
MESAMSSTNSKNNTVDGMEHEIKKIGQKFLPGTRSFDIRYPIMIALASAFLATLAFVRASSINESERSVLLSNGKVIQLGQTKSELAESLKSDLHVVNNNFYQYPADPKKPVEALIYAQGEKITAIEIIGGTSSLVSSGLKLGVSQPDVMVKLNQRIGAFNQRLDALKYKGMAIKQTNSEVYFMTPPCENSSKVIDFTLVDKDYIPTLQSKFIPVDCANSRD